MQAELEAKAEHLRQKREANQAAKAEAKAQRQQRQQQLRQTPPPAPARIGAGAALRAAMDTADTLTLASRQNIGPWTRGVVKLTRDDFAPTANGQPHSSSEAHRDYPRRRF